MQPRVLLASSLAALLVACPAPEEASDGGVRRDAHASVDSALDTATDASGFSCVADSTRGCSCTDGSVGSQRCLRDESAYEACECASYALSVFVRPGSTMGDGSSVHPFGTLTEARDSLRTRRRDGTLPTGDIVVWLHEGLYTLDETFRLSTEDSGSATQTITWRGYPGEHPRITGARPLASSCFVPVDASIGARLEPAARDAVRACDLRSQGITEYGSLDRRRTNNSAAMELFIDGTPGWLARYPDIDADEPPLSLGESVDVYGSPTPDVRGHYVRTGSLDGVSTFQREGLVGGLQYNLHRNTVPGSYVGWFLTVTPEGYPATPDPFWYRYEASLGEMPPSNGATGYVFIGPFDHVSHGFLQTGESTSDRTFAFSGDRPSRWADTSDVWTHGLFIYAWSDDHIRASINNTAHTVRLEDPPNYGLAPNRPYYFYNVLEEITQPGEYYVDRTRGIVYVYPEHALVGADISVSMMEDTLVQLVRTSHLTMRDVTIEGGRANLVEVIEGSDIHLAGLEVRNGGSNGIKVDSASRVTIERAHVHDVGNAGMNVFGGDRTTLTRSNILVQNCEVDHIGRIAWMYQAGIIAGGVGVTLRRNYLHDMPHSAILWGGNEHLFELNRIEHVLKLTSDAGAIYSGRDWGARGNVIRHNLIAHLSTVVEGYGVHGIYLDDVLSGVRVEGNIVYDVSGIAVQHGGGRDDIIQHNVWARCGTGLSSDTRGETAINNTPGDSWNLAEKLRMVGYQSEPWLSRYPSCAAIPSDWAAISAPGAHWRDPEGSVFEGNLGWHISRFVNESGSALSYFATNANNVEDADPHFVDEAAGNYALRDDSPAYAIPGFTRIPYEEIGIAP